MEAVNASETLLTAILQRGITLKKAMLYFCPEDGR
jgi:hypothetical protein